MSGASLTETVVEAGDWGEAEALSDLTERAARAALAAAGVDPAGWEIAALFTDDAHVAALNAHHRGKPMATNVLSWPALPLAPAAPGAPPPAPERPVGAPDAPAPLGDIALACETIETEARELGLAFQEHLAHLLIHGTLHLVGFDHEDDADAELMESLERDALAAIGRAAPQ